jgi:hypothetical protein
LDARELRELMEAATERHRTYRATIRDWSSFRLVSESLGDKHGEEDDEEGESEWRLWLAIDEPGAPLAGEPPSRFRVEQRRDGVLHRLVAGNGESYWSWADGELAESGGPEDEGELFLHFPSPVIPWWEPEPEPEISADEWLGGPVVRARVYGDDFLGPRSDFTDYLVDVERGVLLRAEAFVRGWPAVVEETIDVAFDDELHPSLFDASAWPSA